MRFCFESESQWKVKVEVNTQGTALAAVLQLGREVKARRDRRIFYLFVSLFMLLLFYFRVQALGKANISQERSREKGSSQDLGQHYLHLENNRNFEEDKWSQRLEDSKNIIS